MSKLNSSFCDSVNLDHIIETTITDTLKTTPEFINQNERVIMAQLLSYTKAILGKDGNADDDEISFLMEKHVGELLDTIFNVSHKYIRGGMQAGAHLLLELLLSD